MKGISCYSVIRNSIEGDYCIRECILSMLPIASEVVIGCAVDKEEPIDDGTFAMLKMWEKDEPKLRIIQQEWRQPFNEPRWFVNWINQTREHLRYEQQMFLDADEVLCENAYPTLLKSKPEDCFNFYRLNFWRNGRMLIGKGETCGWMVTRFGPSNLFMPSDEPYPQESTPEICLRASHHPNLRIFHYGFLRSLNGMITKSKVNLRAFFGTFDSRVGNAAMTPNKPWHDSFRHKRPYTTYSGTHPKHCLEWLKERDAL